MKNGITTILKNNSKNYACNMHAKNQINRNKMDNRAKTDIKKLDFMPFTQNISMDISCENKISR